jgi:ABC-type Mn2+/Zn2+ transport system permease subunit
MDWLTDPLSLELFRRALIEAVVMGATCGAIGAYVGRHTRRTNLGLLSIYRTELGGTALFGWSLPRFSATVLAAAGQLVIVQAGLDEEGS